MPHESYSAKLNRIQDFRVKYRFYSPEEGGRKTIPYQGYRSDFWYEDPDHSESNIFMIWPEFEDSAGDLILYNQSAVPVSGTARMWIIVDVVRQYHRDRIRVGTPGWFKEGSRSVGECEVIELGSLVELPLYNPAIGKAPFPVRRPSAIKKSWWKFW